jgi:hypothetical protein
MKSSKIYCRHCAGLQAAVDAGMRCRYRQKLILPMAGRSITLR